MLTCVPWVLIVVLCLSTQGCCTLSPPSAISYGNYSVQGLQLCRLTSLSSLTAPPPSHLYSFQAALAILQTDVLLSYCRPIIGSPGWRRS
ncbi:hypothetical protein C8R43DRAFT_1033460 [Mycena crocata]|nr:hypothetical protein C8R43DRAFT_1033460 [Mycena crocata]